MGCDIHIYFEEKTPQGQWKQVKVFPANIIPRNRDYDLWAFLFNVRNFYEPRYTEHPFAGRGIPEDSSIKNIEKCSDFHSFTYICANEVFSIKWPEPLKDCYFRIFLENTLPLISTSLCGLPLENHRMIICFDN